MNIVPKKFNLLGHTIVVKMNNDRMSDKNALGYCHPLHNEITLADTTDGKPLQESTIEHTFCHELVHLILNVMNENELYKNEKFVDVFGGLLHQYLKTAKF